MIERPKDEAAAAQYPGRSSRTSCGLIPKRCGLLLRLLAKRALQNRHLPTAKRFPGRPKFAGCARQKSDWGTTAVAFVLVAARKASHLASHPSATSASRSGLPRLSKPERRRQRPTRQAETERWKAHRDQRRQTLAQRDQEDEHWRQQRLDLRERYGSGLDHHRLDRHPGDHLQSHRDALGLPLFVAGSAVTAEMIVAGSAVPPAPRTAISDLGSGCTFHRSGVPATGPQ